MADGMDQIRRVAPPKTSRRWWFAAAGVVALALLAAWSLRAGPQPAMEPLTVQFGALAETAPINAVLTPSRAGVVSTISGGTVAEVIAFPGQAVKAGEPLIKLTNADLERQLAEALSEHAGARADLISQRADGTDQANALHMAQVNASNAVRLADMQLEAERKLQQQGVISLLALNRTTAEREGKGAELDYAVQHIAQARTASQAKLSAAGERAAVLQARVNSLQAAVDSLTLKAPFDGVVAKVDGKPGATIAPGTQLAEVITADLQINLEVAEQFADAIHVGQALRFPGGLTGKVVALSPSADGGVVKGRAAIDGDTSKLRSNSAFNGEAILAAHGDGLFVEVEGVDLANKAVGATVLGTDGSSSSRTLRFGPRYRQQVVLLAGAQQGEKILGLDLGAAQ